MKDEKQRTHEDLVVNSDTAAQMFFILYIAVDKTPVSSRHGKNVGIHHLKILNYTFINKQRIKK